MTPQDLREWFNYDKESGWLTLRRSRGGPTKVGERVGRMDKSSGYRRLQAGGRKGLLEHRVIFAWVTGAWPALPIDHINGDASDNRWCNLREATHSQNLANSRNKKHKPKGVYWHERLKKWEALIIVSGKRYYLGVFSSIDDAMAAYNAAGRKAHGKFFRESFHATIS